MREFDTETLKLIAAFESVTKSEVRDCLPGEMIYFLVNSGKAGVAIGKSGKTIKTAEKLFGKPIKILEYSPECTEFVKNLIPQAQKIEISGEKACVTVPLKERGAVIGKSGSNIKVICLLLERNSSIKKLELK